ncbi:MAG: hypothetical protein U5K71_06440 [Gracilimonas sp.]|nr:hypothetical protein [Gracilimonas sp.]
MDTSKNDIWNSDFNFHNLNVEETNRQLKPILKLATEICGVPFSAVILKDKNEQKTLAKYGEWGNEEISKIQSICGKLGSEHEVQVINNIREHPDLKRIFRITI